MVLPQTPSAPPERYRASQDAQHPRDPKRRLLHRPRRLRLAAFATRLPTLEDRLPLLPLLALGRDMGEDARRPAQASASSPEEGPPAERWHSGQPVGQEYRGGRKRARLRWREKDQGQEAPSAGRHAGISARSAGPQRKSDGSGRHQASAGSFLRRSPASPLAPVAGRGLQRPRQGRRLGAKDDGVDGRDRAPSTEAGSGGGNEEVGKGVDQRGCAARSGEAARTAERS